MWKTIRTGDGILKFVIGIARISTRPVGGSYTSMMTCFSKDKMFAASRNAIGPRGTGPVQHKVTSAST